MGGASRARLYLLPGFERAQGSARAHPRRGAQVQCNAPGGSADPPVPPSNKELDADDNEVTRTRKVRRRFVTEKYKAVVDALYGGENNVELVTDITFEDGRKSTI